MSEIFLIHFFITLGLVALVWFIYALVTSPRFRQFVCFWRRKNDSIPLEPSRFSPIILIRLQLVVAFISIALMFGYIALLESTRNDLIRSVFAGIMNAGWMLSFGAPLYEVWDYLEKLELVLLPLDRTWIAFIAGFSPVLTLCTAATMFRLPKFWCMLLFQWSRDIYIFSDLNERAQKYATALQQAQPNKPPYIIFCSDGKEDPVDASNIVGQSLILKQNICHLHLPFFAQPRISFYLVTDDDNMIIEQTIRLNEKYNRRGCRINCVTSGTLNEHVVDQLNKRTANEEAERIEQKRQKQQAWTEKWNKIIKPGKHKTEANDKIETPQTENSADPVTQKPERYITFKNGQVDRSSYAVSKAVQTSYIDIINEAIRVVYYSLFSSEHPLITADFLKKIIPNDQTDAFKQEKNADTYQPASQEGSTVSDGEQKAFTLNALVLGAGTLGEELARTLLWYCQLPGIHVQVTIAAKENRSSIRGRVYRNNPLFEKHLSTIGYADYARLEVRPNTDLLSDELETLLAEKDYHFVFVATGDDNQNYHLALRVRRYYLRHPLSWGYPDIRAVIWDDTVTHIIQENKIQALAGVTEQKDKNKHTDYLLLTDKENLASINNPTCAVTLMGAMEKTIEATHNLEIDAIRYHTHYSGIDTGTILNNGIPIKEYNSYYSTTESNKRSNWAVAIHGKLKSEWYRWQTALPSRKNDDLMSYLARNEHVRWCIFKLLEGDCPLPSQEEVLSQFLVVKGKKIINRDLDTVRGFHSTLRSWHDLTKRANTPIEDTNTPIKDTNTPIKDNEYRAFWQAMIKHNTDLAEFSIAINIPKEQTDKTAATSDHLH